MNDLNLGPRDFDNQFSQFPDGELTGISDVHRSVKVFRPVHHRLKGIQEIVAVAERTRLATVSVDRDRLAGQRLSDEVADHPTVIRMHPRTIGIEDANDPNIDFVLAVVIEHQRLGGPLAFVVTRANADWIDASAVRLGLRMNLRISVHLTGRGMQDPRPEPLGQPQHVDRAHDRSLNRLDRVVLVVTRCGGTGEVIDLVDFSLVGIDHVVADELEVRPADQVFDVGLLAREEIIEAEHLMPLIDEAITEMRAEEAGAAGNKNPLDHVG